MSWFRENWRIAALVVLVVASSVALFAPGIGASANTSGQQAATGDPTNLNYGLELSGGVRLRTTVTGVTADGVSVTPDNEGEIATRISTALDVERGNVRARPASGSVEVYQNVSTSSLRTTLEDAGYSPDSVRRGVTQATRDNIVSIIGSKIDATGLGGAEVKDIETSAGAQAHYIVVEVPGQNASQVQSLIQGRGQVTLDAYYPGSNGTNVNATVLRGDELVEVDQPKRDQNGRPFVPVQLSAEAAQRFTGDMTQYGFTSQAGISNCRFPNGGYCLLTKLDGEEVYNASMGPTLARTLSSGKFVNSPSFRITANSMTAARNLQVNLQAGALPAEITVQNSYYVAPSFAQKYKPLSLVTGLAAAIAVAIMVLLRYGEPKIAIPMVFTALAEVVILLGFASVSGLALDLSHLAGFIAVIGTGVDDLVIIADEVMTEQVSSSRIFQSRFRKALWVIGAAAATTILAMSPLAVLSLGDLRGFALVTILGVLIGVLVTRPAYGDVLRRLLTTDT
ncbi:MULTISPECIES: preprotein translocase subunit SecD [Halobacterium]|uniref:preprotein translocase subunit SecD n=1 Tax=Halobacterium TaxID=2239 RepID=UPI0019625E79|nr:MULTISPECIES: preprotein translocase subunit SecD [Halobacterium]MDL0122842.1 preprotein translocase subunit SecD [Halobacterium salinarum]MDL0128595.1 preprotein translocase subunit SecD [Halobacterium salinarum]MDL0132633.1 preprotein translocase subunit SecD [Halobacterium salinarum]QRY24298.1 preprotein translocase subunit SecD [Halobacterium sp. BOL4-2]